MNTHNKCFLRETRKMSIFGQVNTLIRLCLYRLIMAVVFRIGFEYLESCNVAVYLYFSYFRVLKCGLFVF